MLGLLIVVQTSAFADSHDFNEDQGFYLGLQLGYANMNYDKSWFRSESGYTPDSVNSDGVAGRFNVGFQFNAYFATEFGFLVLPDIKFNHLEGTDVNAQFSEFAGDILVKGMLPLKYGFGLFVKGGVGYVSRDDYEESVNNITVKSDHTDDNTVPVVGGGVSYAFGQHFSIDASYLRYFESGDLKPIDFGSIGIQFLF